MHESRTKTRVGQFLVSSFPVASSSFKKLLREESDRATDVVGSAANCARRKPDTARGSDVVTTDARATCSLGAVVRASQVHEGSHGLLSVHTCDDAR